MEEGRVEGSAVRSLHGSRGGSLKTTKSYLIPGVDLVL